MILFRGGTSVCVCVHSQVHVCFSAYTECLSSVVAQAAGGLTFAASCW